MWHAAIGISLIIRFMWIMPFSNSPHKWLPREPTKDMHTKSYFVHSSIRQRSKLKICFARQRNSASNFSFLTTSPSPNQYLKLKVKPKFIKPSKLRQWSSNYTIVRAKDLEACLQEPLIARCKPNVFLTLPYVGREVGPHKEKNQLIGKYKDDQ